MTIPIQLVETTTEALHYYLINSTTAIPRSGNSQEILNSYIDFNKLHTLPICIVEYPCIPRETFKLLFPDVTILETTVHYIKFDYTEWEQPPPECTTEAQDF